MARQIYIYINKNAMVKNPKVKEFVEFYLENAAPLVEEVGYIPLQDEDYRNGLRKIQGM